MELPAEDAMTWLEAVATAVFILAAIPFLTWIVVVRIFGG